MIINLPKQFPLDKLAQFTIGSVEPESDSLLDHNLGICKIHPVLEFIRGTKSLIVGPRGTGKSTLVKLVREGRIVFAGDKQCKDTILSLDESLDYIEVKNKVFDLFHTPIQDDAVKCRYFWEIYLLFRILTSFEKDYPDLPIVLKKNLNNIKLILRYEDQKITILEFLKNLKWTSGLKITQSPEGASVTPHVSMEPSPVGATTDQQIIKFNIETCKKEVNSFLKSNNSRYFIFFDIVDEFVVKEAYSAQKMFIQGLLECEKSYIKHDRIKLKLFLRSDLFDRLDYETLGSEKVAARKIDLIWSSQDIRRLIAQRITYNYLFLFNLPLLQLVIKEHQLYIDESSAIDNEGSVGGHRLTFLRKMIDKFRVRDSRSGRHISFTDEANREIITSIFPRSVKHRSSSGKSENCDIMEFCSSHLSLSNAILTPRIAIMFIEKCLDCTRNYYKDNPDIRKVELDENNEYPLIKKICFSNAYEEFRNDLWESFHKNMPGIWKPFFNTLRWKRGAKYEFSYKELEKLLHFNDNEQLRQFIAFLCHIGILENINPTNRLPQRTYKLPVVLRQ
jgi:hypothetical protein